ncbi:hypothetical protein NC652_038790 [Populus alba x Populus x berolinensis]|nr:hypothetical protein NC652_038790 [Populus alba x Populus x berolinensis]
MTTCYHKAVLRLDLHEEKTKKKAMKTVSRLPGVHSISMEMKDQKLTVIGDIDPVHIVAKLRKLCCTEIVTVGPAKEPEKKKDDPKKQGDEKKKDEDRAQKAVLKVELHDEKAKKKAMKTVSGLAGVDSVSIDMKEKKLTVTGGIDPVCIVGKLRKLCHTDIVTVGPAKEPEKKKEEPPKKPAGDQKKDPDPKAVLKVELHDEKAKKKAMKTVSGLSGVDSVSIDMKEKKLTVIGDIDPVHIVAKLRKLCCTEIVTVGPAKEPEKKKDDPKKQGGQKKKDQDQDQYQVAYQAYNPHMPPYYYARSVEEAPNACKAGLKLGFHDDKAKKKAMKTVSSLSGDGDPIVAKSRKLCGAEMVTAGPAKEPGKRKDEPKKEQFLKNKFQNKDNQKNHKMILCTLRSWTNFKNERARLFPFPLQ